MLTSVDIDIISDPLIKLYDTIERELVVNVARNIALGEMGKGDEMAWLLRKMQQAGIMTAENKQIIKNLSGATEFTLNSIFEAVGAGTLEPAEAMYTEAAANWMLKYRPLPLKSDEALKQIIEAAVKNAADTMNLVNTTAIVSAQADFLKLVNQIYLETVTGLYSYRDSLRKAVSKLAQDGVTGAVYKTQSGRIINTPMDVVVRRAILTSSSQTAGKLQIKRADEWGAEYMEVSSHWNARPSHALWQGRVYKLEGEAPGYPNFYTATGYGTGTGLCGYNCRHVFYPFFMGLSSQKYYPYDLEENERRYNESQKQRAYEREVRKETRAEAAHKATGDTEAAKAAASRKANAQSKLSQLVKDTGRVRRPEREIPPEMQ